MIVVSDSMGDGRLNLHVGGQAASEVLACCRPGDIYRVIAGNKSDGHFVEVKSCI